MRTIREVLKGVYENPTLRRMSVPLFIGNPGLGKTQIIQSFANEKGVRLFKMVASQRMPHEISGIAIPDPATKVMTYYDYDQLIQLRDGDILFLDEVTNAQSIILAALLTILEDRTLISGQKLADIMIVAAANYQGMDRLPPQIIERFIWYDVKYDANLYKEFLLKQYTVLPDTMFEGINRYINSQNFDMADGSFNLFTPRSVHKAIEYAIYNVPSPYYSKLELLLNTPIMNDTGKTIVHKYTKIAPDEFIPWVKLQRMKRNLI